MYWNIDTMGASAIIGSFNLYMRCIETHFDYQSHLLSYFFNLYMRCIETFAKLQ